MAHRGVPGCFGHVLGASGCLLKPAASSALASLACGPSRCARLLWKLVGGFGLFIGPWCFASTCCLARGFSELPWCGKPNRALVLPFAPVSFHCGSASFGDLFGPGGCVLPSTLWPCLWLQVWQGQIGPLGLLDLASLLSSGRQLHSKGGARIRQISLV